MRFASLLTVMMNKFTGVLEPLARVALERTNKDGLGTWFAAA